ncbi:Uncharacterized protein TCM_035551 [Theobroma cacao]|uniref:Uncharacterized protein n=1 Tax=Theobroma cacao TaxID=3641 RepID=A0A061FHB8_THECC|nr:Uncharacterized protein TCM_035551 [Theobroma cacao]
MEQEVQLAQPGIEQAAGEAYQGNGKTVDTTPIEKKTVRRGRKRMATKTKVFIRRKSIRIAKSTTKLVPKSGSPQVISFKPSSPFELELKPLHVHLGTDKSSLNESSFDFD